MFFSTFFSGEENIFLTGPHDNSKLKDWVRRPTVCDQRNRIFLAANKFTSFVLSHQNLGSGSALKPVRIHNSDTIHVNGRSPDKI
jgi:hypothetical protein